MLVGVFDVAPGRYRPMLPACTSSGLLLGRLRSPARPDHLPGKGSLVQPSEAVVLLRLHFGAHTFLTCCHFTYTQNNTATFASVKHSGTDRLQ